MVKMSVSPRNRLRQNEDRFCSFESHWAMTKPLKLTRRTVCHYLVGSIAFSVWLHSYYSLAYVSFVRSETPDYLKQAAVYCMRSNINSTVDAALKMLSLNRYRKQVFSSILLRQSQTNNEKEKLTNNGQRTNRNKWNCEKKPRKTKIIERNEVIRTAVWVSFTLQALVRVCVYTHKIISFAMQCALFPVVSYNL